MRSRLIADEFLAFLKKTDREILAHLDLHLILDNTPTTECGSETLAGKTHELHLRLPPTSFSWFNLVERHFAKITRQRTRRGIFRNVAELKAATGEWIER